MNEVYCLHFNVYTSIEDKSMINPLATSFGFLVLTPLGLADDRDAYLLGIVHS